MEAVIQVRDTGCGIDGERLDHVFDPYYTTRDSSDGMGIGLFITKKVIENHEGRIGLTNNPDKGATATVHIPLADTA